MKIKSSLEVVLLWYFANFEKEQNMRGAMGYDYELPFYSGFFEEEILATLIDFEKKQLIPKVTVSRAEGGLTFKSWKEPFNEAIEKSEMSKAVKKRWLNNKMYLADIQKLQQCDLRYGKFKQDFFEEIIKPDLRYFEYPKELDSIPARHELTTYAESISRSYSVLYDFELVKLSEYMSQVDIGTKLYELYCKNVGLEFSTREEIEMYDENISKVVDEEIAAITLFLAEMLGQIKIRRMTVLYNGYTGKPMANIIYSIIPKEMRVKVPAGNTKVYKLYCSKINKFRKFHIIFNDLIDKKIELKYSNIYSRLLYDVVHNDKYTHPNTEGLDEHIRRASGIATGKKATYSRELPELQFVNLFERRGREVFSNGCVELVPGQS